MPVLVISTFDVPKLSVPALKILKAAVNYAQRNGQTAPHKLSIDEFCSWACLPLLTVEDFSMLLQEASKTLAVVEVVDTSSPDRNDLPYASWPVFSEVGIDGFCFTFEISSRTFDERLLASLPMLQTSGQQPNRYCHRPESALRTSRTRFSRLSRFNATS